MILLTDLLIESSQAAQDAKAQGLTYMRFGRWGKDGKVTHTTNNGRLVPIKPSIRPSVDKQPKGRAPRVVNPQPQTGPVAPVKSAPTKENPSFDELRQEARKHKFTVMTRVPLKQIRSGTPVDSNTNQIGKPAGFWFGVGSEWVDWTEYEMPDWKGDNLYSVEVDESQCLVIQDEFDFKDFSRTYGTPDGLIDWGRVSKDHKGVIIREYFPKYRMNPYYRWYYSWDIASGCVWDASAIRQVEQVSI